MNTELFLWCKAVWWSVVKSQTQGRRAACYLNVLGRKENDVQSVRTQQSQIQTRSKQCFWFYCCFHFGVRVALKPLPCGGLSNSRSRLHYWTGHSEWLLLTSCCSTLTPVSEYMCVGACVSMCLCVCVWYACVRDPEWLVSNKEMKSIVGFFFFSPPQRTIFFYYFTCTSLSHWVCTHAAANSQTSIGSIYLVDRSAEWLLLLSRPHKKHCN